MSSPSIDRVTHRRARRGAPTTGRRRLVVGLLALALMLSAGPAFALRFGNVSGTTTGTQSFTQPVAPNGSTAAPITATWSQTGTTLTTPTTDNWPWTDGTAAQFNNTLVAAVAAGQATARSLRVVGTTCASNNTSPICTGRGTITIAFSQAVTNPVLYLAGFGENQGDNQVSGVLDVASAVNGAASATVTFTDLFSNNNTVPTAGSPSLQVSGGGTRVETVSTRPGTNCNSAGSGTTLNGRAGCGLVQLTGTFTSITFNVALKANNATTTTLTATAGDTISLYVQLQDQPVPTAAADTLSVTRGATGSATVLSNDTAAVQGGNPIPPNGPSWGFDPGTTTPTTTPPDPDDPEFPGLPGNPVETRWGNLTLTKVEAGTTAPGLEGAQFEVYLSQAAAEAGTAPIGIDADNNPATPDQTVWITPAGGVLTISGLRFSEWADGAIDPTPQTYWLREIVAPSGYELLAQPMGPFTVNAVDTASDVTVENPLKNGGFELPFTGATGQWLFPVGGVLLLAGAGLLLVGKSRRNKQSI